MNKFIKKLGVLALTCTLSVSLLAGCGAKKEASTDSTSANTEEDAKINGNGIKVLFSLTDRDDTFRAKLAESVETAAKSCNVSLDTKLCNNDTKVQLKDIKEAEANGYKAIIVRLADAQTALQMATATNLPVIFINSAPESSVLKKDKDIYVGSNEYDAGKMQVEYVLKKLNNPKSMNIIILKGERGHSGATQRTSAVKTALKAAGVDYTIVFSDYGSSWSPENGREMMDAFFKTGQTVNAVFSNNDSMAIGAVESMKAHGLSLSTIPVVGVDATADACASIKAGEMQFTVLQNASMQCARAVQAAVTLGNKKSISTITGASKDKCYIWVPFEPVDSSNVDKY